MNESILRPSAPTPSRTSFFARWLVNTLRPSVMNVSRGPRKELSPTSYLDGLRGFAALLVYLHHHQVWARLADMDVANRIFANAWGYDGQYYFACLPGIRNFFSGGHFAVCMFFVISGHVLSTKSLALIHSKEFVKFEESISSALFRRWLRLFIPAAGVTFVYMTCWHWLDLYIPAPTKEGSYREEVWVWYLTFKKFSFALIPSGDDERWFRYNFHLWSIPLEFRGSILVYTTLLALSRGTRNAKLACKLGLMFYFTYIVPNGCFYAMFIAGMLIGELQLLARKNDLPEFSAQLRPYKKAIFYTLFVVGMFLSGVPSYDDEDPQILRDSPGWYYLSYLVPNTVQETKWFYLLIAGSFTVASVPEISWLKSFFESHFNQYLGHISFALYLVHGPILWTLGDRIYLAAGWVRDSQVDGVVDWINRFPIPKSGPFGLELAWILPQTVILPFTLWIAEISTKVFDEPSVRIAHWLYGKAK